MDFKSPGYGPPVKLSLNINWASYLNLQERFDDVPDSSFPYLKAGQQNPELIQRLSAPMVEFFAPGLMRICNSLSMLVLPKQLYTEHITNDPTIPFVRILLWLRNFYTQGGHASTIELRARIDVLCAFHMAFRVLEMIEQVQQVEEYVLEILLHTELNLHEIQCF
jgi:hypothetical protein